jgi:hypothetical protein
VGKNSRVEEKRGRMPILPMLFAFDETFGPSFLEIPQIQQQGVSAQSGQGQKLLAPFEIVAFPAAGQTLPAATLSDLAGWISAPVFTGLSAPQPDHGTQAIITLLVVFELFEGHLLSRQLEFALSQSFLQVPGQIGDVTLLLEAGTFSAVHPAVCN